MATPNSEKDIASAITRLSIAVGSLNLDPAKTIAQYREDQARQERLTRLAALSAAGAAVAAALAAIATPGAWLYPLAR